MGLFDFFAEVEKEYLHIENIDMQKLVGEKGLGTLSIIDVRTIGEYMNGHIPGAQNMNVMAPNFEDQISKLDRSKAHYIVCASGNRSKKACGIMQKYGFAEVVNVKGGMIDWQGPIE